MSPRPLLMSLLCCANGLSAGESLSWNGDLEFNDNDELSKNGWEWSFGGDIEALFIATGNPPAGLVKEPGSNFAPRLTLELDLLPNDYWFAHVTVRADRGFDPLDKPDGEVRIDEAFLRYRPFGDTSLNIQIGKSATVFGSWVNGHDIYDDPFLTAPLPYSQIIGIGVLNPGSLSPTAIAGRNSGINPGVFETPKRSWTSTIWGPAYTTGLTVFGNSGTFDYGFEIKNQGLPSHPKTWNPDSEEYDDPSYTGRLGYRPNAAWSFGLSASHGPYLETSAEEFLPEGIDRGDLPYTIIGFDARWSHRNWILSMEVIGSEFQTLEAGDLRSLSYTAQARWKLSPGVWVAGRFGQTINNDARGPNGEDVEWSPDIWRIGAAIGWRVTPDLLLKTEYNYTHLDDPRVDDQGLFGFGVNYRF